MKRKILPFQRAMGTQRSIREPHWRATALAFAAAVAIGFPASDAHALALGRVTVQSALGEPLRAEIEIPEINADEVASLKANIASPDAFRAAGVEYNAALGDVHITLEKRANGSYFLRLSSARAVNDPFIDLILDTSWSQGRISRDYTMLFDPPSMRAPQQPLQAQAAPAPQAARSSTPTPLPPAGPATRARGGSRAAPAAAPAPAASAPSLAAVPSGEGKQVTVQPGDTAGKIASANKPPAVSLDQMLVAMLRANPDAFIAGNINRVRAGSVLQVPGEQEAGLVPPDDAKQTLVAQSRDFNEFRRRVAENVPQAKATPAERQSSGKITAQVEEKKPTANAPDKLTLSKGAATGKSGAEDKIAQQRAAQDAATRVAELNKNIADLGKVGKPSAPAAAATPAASAGKPGIPVPLGTPAAAGKTASAPVVAAPTPAPATAPAPAMTAASAAKNVAPAVAAAAKPAPAPAVAASAIAPVATAASATIPAASASVAAASAMAAPASAAKPVVSAAVVAPVKAPAKPAAAAPPPPPETSLLDEILDNPLALGLAGLVALIAAGFGFYKVQQRRKTTQVDSSFLESRLQPDSFFGASGGQRIDTNEGGVTGSSMVYSPSQLDAAGDVDPVAEADVYLAYGRDLQAEEILKEALRTQPQRVAIHAKLLEIYAKRRDGKAFELIATEAYGLTHGEGGDWEKICELGQELDPGNSLYRPGGQPSEGAVAAAAAAGAAATFDKTQVAQAIPLAEDVAQPDIDLDLDFSIGDDDPAAAPAAPAASERTQAVAATAPTFDRTQAVESPPPVPALDMDFGAPEAAAPAAAPHSAPPAAMLDAPDLVLDEHSLNFDATPVPPPPPPAPLQAAAAAAPKDDGMLEFDLGAISLDLPDAKKDAAAPAPAPAHAEAVPEIETPTTAGAPLSTAGFDDPGGDPLVTKFALAQEFNAIGDPDGARTLAQEVIAEASGELKSAAQKFLAEIS